MAEEAAEGSGPESKAVPVWDLPTRIFHWALVALIALSYATAELGLGDMQLHVYSGYGILTLLIFRVLWGFLGPRHARFSSFLRSPSATLAYARSLLSGQERRYLGHNPLGALSVVAFLLLIGFQVTSGLFAQDDILTEGPLAPLVSSDLSEELTDLHEDNFNFILALIALHLLAIAFHSFVKREGLIRAMLSGRKKAGESADAEADAAAPGAAVTLWGLAVLAAAAAAVYAILELLPAALG